MSQEVIDDSGQEVRRDAKGRRRSRGFTLLELLIVVGIIALLMAIVVTAMTKVRGSAKRVQCLSNLRTIGSAIHQYVADNNDTFPLAAPNKTPQKPGDFLYWQSTPMGTGSQFAIDLVGSGGVGKYIGALDDLSPAGLQSLRCPADDRLEIGGFLATSPQQTAAHMAYPAGYPFSYVINAFMVSGNYPDNGPDVSAIARTMSKVKDAADKIIVYEEDPRTINDGVCDPRPNGSTTNLLSVRHELHEPLTANSMTNPPDPEAAINVTIGPPQPPLNLPTIATMNHADLQGNCLFVDGHAEAVSRRFAHSKAHYAPDPNHPSLASLP